MRLKDYILIADALRKVRNSSNTVISWTVWRACAECIADAITDMDRNFNRLKWLEYVYRR